MKIIDTHVHVFPDALEPRAIQALSVPQREAKIKGTLEATHARMRKLGVSCSWTVPVATKAAQVASINEYAVAQDRRYFQPFGAIHPDVEDAYQLLSTYRSQGLPGFKIHPDYEGVRPTDARMQPLYDAAMDFNLICYFHAGDDVGPRTKYGSPTEFMTVLDEYPGIRMVLAHLGGYRMWDEVEEKLVGREVYFDTAYTMTEMPREQLLRIMRHHGTERILFGSDSPWTRLEDEIDFFMTLDEFSETEKEALFHGNAENLLQSAGFSF
jgi:predicted TIM-barrel fold metal-dependent hydrolase